MIKFLICGFIFINCLQAQTASDTLDNKIKQASGAEKVKFIIQKAYILGKGEKVEEAILLLKDAEKIATKIEDNTSRTKVLASLGDLYFNNFNMDSSLNVFNRLMVHGKKTNDEFAIYIAALNLAAIWGEKNNKSLEEQNNTLALHYAKKRKDRIGEAIVLGNRGHYYLNKGEFAKGLQNSFQSLKISEEIKDSVGLGYMYLAIGDAYITSQDTSKSLQYFIRGKQIFDRIGTDREKVIALMSVSNGYLVIKDTLNAKKMFLELKLFSEKHNSSDGLVKAYEGLGTIEGKTNPQKALEYFEKGTKLAEQTGNIFNLVLIYTQKACLLIKMGKKSEAIVLLKTTLKMTEGSDLPLNMMTILELLEKAYQKNGEFENAYATLKKLTALKDSSFSISRLNSLNELQTKFETEKKEKENALLRKEIENQQRIKTYYIVISILSVILVGIVFFLYKNKNRANQLLKELNKTKDIFFTIIAHDLKNPFISLLGYTELLIKEFANFDEEEKKDCILAIERTARHTYNLLENLLQWSRSQNGELLLSPQNLNIYRLVEESLNISKSMAETKKITIINEIDAKHSVYADVNTTLAVIRNLLSNAIKYTNVDGIIRIKSVVKKTMVEVYFEDNGIGISEANLKKLFHLDSHFTTQGTAKERGTGLGLLICKDFIEKNKGQILVKSKKGEGSTFIFTLPIYQG